MSTTEKNPPEGGEGKDGGPTPPATPTPPPAPPASSDDSIPKDQFEKMLNDRMANLKKSQADKIKELTGDLSQEEVKDILAAHTERIQSEKSEHTKAVEAANKAQADAEAMTAQALSDSLRAKLTLALMGPAEDAEGNDLPPVDRQYLDTVLDLALPLAVASEDDDPIADAVGKVRVSAAPMFAVPTPEPSNKNGNGKGPAPTPQRKLGEKKTDDQQTAEEAAIARFRDRSSQI